MTLSVRKIVHHIDETLIEGGREAQRAHCLAAVAAVIKNPWAGGPFVEDLNDKIVEVAPQLGELLVPRLLRLIDADRIEAHGKSAIVGLEGEIEHGCALIHTLYFGNIFRQAVNASTFIPSTNKRGGANASITMPLKHTREDGARAHFMTIEFAIPDAPGPDEIVIAIGAANSGRPHHRIGDRYEDMKILGKDQTNTPL